MKKPRELNPINNETCYTVYYRYQNSVKHKVILSGEELPNDWFAIDKYPFSNEEWLRDPAELHTVYFIATSVCFEVTEKMESFSACRSTHTRNIIWFDENLRSRYDN